jgi:hypothetical protein
MEVEALPQGEEPVEAELVSESALLVKEVRKTGDLADKLGKRMQKIEPLVESSKQAISDRAEIRKLSREAGEKLEKLMFSTVEPFFEAFKKGSSEEFSEKDLAVAVKTVRAIGPGDGLVLKIRDIVINYFKEVLPLVDKSMSQRESGEIVDGLVEVALSVPSYVPIVQRVAVAFAKTFSAKELKALQKFFAADTGKSITQKVGTTLPLELVKGLNSVIEPFTRETFTKELIATAAIQRIIKSIKKNGAEVEETSKKSPKKKRKDLGDKAKIEKVTSRKKRKLNHSSDDSDN